MILPHIACKGLCTDQCSIAPMTAAEVEALQNASGMTFDVLPNPIGAGTFIIDKPGCEALTCPALVDGRCAGYEARPLICRLYGVAEGLTCPHGCKPSRILTRAEAAAIMQAHYDQ